jgi:uncharacterized membrane protein YraQ (UPF0718 family)
VDKAVFDFVATFASIIWEAFPFVVLGAILSGLLEEAVPQQFIGELIPKKTLLAVSIGARLGLLFPMCECGIVPVMRRLLSKGLPIGTCVSYMLAGPIINFIVILATFAAFQAHGIVWEMLTLRIVLGYIVAVITAWIVQGQFKKYGNKLLTPAAQQTAGAANADRRDVGFWLGLAYFAVPEVIWIVRLVIWLVRTVPNRDRHRQVVRHLSSISVSRMSESALRDFVDIMVFLTLGACLAGVIKVWGPTPDDVQQYSEGYPALTILGMMGMAVIMCLCSEADAFVAASFTTMHPSAKLAFLVLGPMFDLKLLFMVTRVFRRRVMTTIIISVAIQVFVYCLAVHYLWPDIRHLFGHTGVSG